MNTFIKFGLWVKYNCQDGCLDKFLPDIVHQVPWPPLFPTHISTFNLYLCYQVHSINFFMAQALIFPSTKWHKVGTWCHLFFGNPSSKSSLLLTRSIWMIFRWNPVNSMRLTDAYMSLGARPSLDQIMACRLVGTKPLSEPMLEYC